MGALALTMICKYWWNYDNFSMPSSSAKNELSLERQGNLELDAQGNNNVQVSAIVGLSRGGNMAYKEKGKDIIAMQEFQCVCIPS